VESYSARVARDSDCCPSRCRCISQPCAMGNVEKSLGGGETETKGLDIQRFRLWMECDDDNQGTDDEFFHALYSSKRLISIRLACQAWHETHPWMPQRFRA